MQLVMTTKVALTLKNLPESHVLRREVLSNLNLRRKVHLPRELRVVITLKRKRRTHQGWIQLHQRMRKVSKAIQVKKSRSIRLRYLGCLLTNHYHKIM
jgi:hypothetical protein